MTVASVVNSVRSAVSSDLRGMYVNYISLTPLKKTSFMIAGTQKYSWFLDFDLAPCNFIKLIYSCE